MDGTARRVLHSINVTAPYGITLDIDTQTLYWTDYTLNILVKSNTDGTGRMTLTNRMISNPTYITYYDGNLYWSDWSYNRILTTPVFAPDNVTFLTNRLSYGIYGMEVISPDKQQQG